MTRNSDRFPADMPLKARRAYKVQMYNANQRGIQFLFSPADWWSWWNVDGRWERRGLGAENLCMARNGDIGPYSPENVHLATNMQNMREVPKEVRSAAILKSYESRDGFMKGKRGQEHPKSRKVVTPSGIFGSASLAAEHYGITRQTAAHRARDGLFGWSYAEE